MIEVKRCPFCGSEGEVFLHTLFGRKKAYQYSVHCKNCGAFSDTFSSRKTAAECWNEGNVVLIKNGEWLSAMKGVSSNV